MSRSSAFFQRHRVLAVASVPLLTVGMVGLVASAQGASPTSGELSDASRSVAWSGGPLVGADPGALLGTGPVACVAGTCDAFSLKVSAPAGYGSSHNLTITVTASSPSGQDDFDLYLLDAAGTVVASGAKSGDETVTIPVPAAGTYSADVIAYTAAAGSYTATAKITDGTAPTPGPTPGPGPLPTDPNAPGYAAYPAPKDLPGVDDAGEPSIGDHYTDPKVADAADPVMYQAGLHTYKALFDDTVSPAKATWTDVTASVTNGCPAGDTESLDPILYTDPATGRTFESQLTGQDSLTCYTDDDGATWNPSQGGGIVSGVDHQTIGGGPYSPDDVLGPLPTSDYPDAVYYCSQDIAAAFCAASHDGGTTFPVVTPTYTLLDCGGLHGHLRVAPDGTAYLPNKSCNDASGNRANAVVVSTDGGLNWAVKPITGTTEGDSDPSVAIGRNGTVYAGYVQTTNTVEGLPGTAVSHDKGDTWTDLHVAGASVPCTGASDVGPCGVKSAVFPTMTAGDDDRAAFAYLGTTTGGDYQAATFAGVWHLYVDTTYDGGKTWTTTDATPADPVQRGTLCTAGTTCPTGTRNLLDFIDITHDDHGKVEVGFADGCIDACVTDPGANGHDAYSTIARQTTGKTLYAKYDPATTPTDPTTDPTSNPTTDPTSNPTTDPTTDPTSDPNTPPTARAKATPRLATVRDQVLLSGAGSSDAETPSASLTYGWYFGKDASPSSAQGQHVTTSYAHPGTHTVLMAVTDEGGSTDWTTTTVQVGSRHSCLALHHEGGWHSRHAAGADRGKYCTTSGGRATLSSRFGGSLLGIAFGTVKGGGSAQVLVDGVRVRTLHFAGRTTAPRFGRHVVVGGLGSGRHTLQVVATGRAVLDTLTY